MAISYDRLAATDLNEGQGEKVSVTAIQGVTFIHRTD